MAQLTVYMDDVTIKKIEVAAKREHNSVSKWVKKRLMTSLENTWPENYFELFGSLKDENFRRPKQLSLEADIREENL